MFSNNPKAGKLDYVAAWYKLAATYMQGTQINAATPSAEDAVLALYIAAEKEEQRRHLIEFFKTRLTAKQYRRMCLYYLDHMTEAEIAALERVGQRRISTSITTGRKIVEKFLPEFFRR